MVTSQKHFDRQTKSGLVHHIFESGLEYGTLILNLIDYLENYWFKPMGITKLFTETSDHSQRSRFVLFARYSYTSSEQAEQATPDIWSWAGHNA